MNTTLKSLNLLSEEEREEKREIEKDEEIMTGNDIGDEGKKMVRNTWGEKEGKGIKRKKKPI